MPVIVNVGDAGAHRSVRDVIGFAIAPRNAGRHSDIGELGAIISKQTIRVTIHVRDVQVEIAVFVVIEPHRAHCFARIGDPKFSGDIDKVCIGIPEQHVRSITKRDKQVEITIPIEINKRWLTNRARIARDPNIRRYVDKLATRIAIQLEQRCRSRSETHK